MNDLVDCPLGFQLRLCGHVDTRVINVNKKLFVVLFDKYMVIWTGRAKDRSVQRDHPFRFQTANMFSIVGVYILSRD